MTSRPSSQSMANLRAYFGQYPGFTYDPTQPATSEFRRLRSFLTGQGIDAGQAASRQTFADALGNQFSERYGRDIGDLPAWQKLCRRIGIAPMPSTLEGAREAVRGTYFNIIDVIDDGTDGSLPTFSTKQELRAYSTREKKQFPSQCATLTGILTSVLNRGAPSTDRAANVNAEEPSVDSLNAALASMHIGSTQNNDIANLAQPPFIEPMSDDEEEEILPLQAFFVGFAGFQYNPTRPSKSEFRRLCRTMGWTKRDPALSNAYIEFSEAMANQFGRKFGVDMDDLGAWQRLCARLEIDPIPDDLEEAREAVFNTYANMVDLIDEGRVVTFPTEMALSSYTIRRKKKFPMGGLVAGDILKSLLRYINFPPPVGSRRTSLGVLIRA